MIKKLCILIIFTIFSLPVYSVNFEPEERINISVYERISPAIVAIEGQQEDGMSAGTGCILTKDGLILTGFHVIEGCKDIDVTINNGQTYKAKVLSKLKRDLALIKIEPKKPLETVVLGNSEDVKVGQKVLAIGNPFGFNNTLTQGIISRIDYSKNRIQTDAAINPGCSGGPLLNTAGEVIGINQSIYNPDHNISNIGIGFAIPINEAKPYLKLANRTK